MAVLPLKEDYLRRNHGAHKQEVVDAKSSAKFSENESQANEVEKQQKER